MNRGILLRLFVFVPLWTLFVAGCAHIGRDSEQMIDIVGTVVRVVDRDQLGEGAILRPQGGEYTKVLVVRPDSVSGPHVAWLWHDGMLWVGESWPEGFIPSGESMIGQQVHVRLWHGRSRSKDEYVRLNVFGPIETDGQKREKTAQPGATDNPDDAQRLREDH